jgi:hypothetical protein
MWMKLGMKTGITQSGPSIRRMGKGGYFYMYIASSILLTQALRP